MELTATEQTQPAATPSANADSILLSNLLTASESGVLLAMDESGELRVARANNQIRRQFALGGAPLEGIAFHEFVQRIKPLVDSSENVVAWERQMLNPPDDEVVMETQLHAPDTRILRQTLSPALDSEGNRIGLLLMVRDITYDKHLEDQAIHTQKMESVGTLAGGIAHDFNNILTAILGYSSALKMDIESNKGALKKLEQIIRSAHRAADLTRNLLAFSRKNPHIPQVIDVNKLVADTCGMLEFAMPDSINLKTKLGESLPCIEADASQIQQVLTHLVVNARDAIFQDGTIRVSTHVGMDDQTNPDEEPVEYVVLDVEDDGVGIPKESLSRIFEPFYTTKETGKGIGLGLAMVYGTVKQHYGFVEVESAPNMGSRFSIYLPSTEKTLPREPEAEAPDVRTHAAKDSTILVVDDEEDLRMLCETALGDVCKKVLTARDGEEGVEIFRQHADEIDLVILDMTMPKMDGAECFGKLREIRPDAAVLISSGYSRDMGAGDLLQNGALGFLEKPYTMAKLVQHVEDTLAKHQASG